jgi:hypothetical protein
VGAHSGPDINENGLVLALDGANYRSFKGEATTNYYSTPETLTDGRVGTTSGGTYTDFTTGGPSGGRFTRWTNNTGTSGTTAWHWGIGYTNTGLTTGQTLTVSFYARCPNGTLSNITLNSPDSTAINATLDSTWRRYSGQIIYGGDYTSTPFFRINRSNSNSYTNGATYDIANIQIETKSYSTTFTTGTRGTTVATGGGWADLTGNGNNGELVNGVRESANNLGSLSFDGVDDYVNAPVTKSATCTFSCWARTTTLATSPMLFNAGPNGVGPDLFFYLGNIYWNIWDGAGNPFATTPASVTDGNYHYYVVVNDALSNTKLYYDGILLGTATYRTAANNTNLTIGGNTSAYMWNGNISNFTIHNRALTASEIQQNYNATRSRFGI